MEDEAAASTALKQADDNGGETKTKAAPTGPIVDDSNGPKETPPRLPPRPPPRPSQVDSLERPSTPLPARPKFQAQPTTALSSIDIQTLSFPDGSRGTFSSTDNTASPSAAGTSVLDYSHRRDSQSRNEADDNASLQTFTGTTHTGGGDLESLLGGSNAQSAAWKMLSGQAETVNPFETIEHLENDKLAIFEQEFDEIQDVNSELGNEEQLLEQFKSKLKHYMIFSSAGKPIYSRHGDVNLINGYIGVIQTIISFYEESSDPLQSFTAGDTKFVVSAQGPLYFVAISSLGESEAQLRIQLDALYMQILSTLTLPRLTQIFTNRPSTDLRRPLEGTDVLLSSLADTFTKGSASTLLSALECLKIRKSQRHVINNTLLKTRTDKLLYGLIVAGGRLVSVVRPKRHSLHPSDLQLIFNMLFEAKSIRSGGGENWIPLCLPGFNNTGYVYMYVSFLDSDSDSSADNTSHPQTPESTTSSRDDAVAVLLISTDKESFYELKQMRDAVVAQLHKNGSLDIIKNAVRAGRPSTTDIVPGTQLRHFLYKSRANVQFTTSSYGPHFNSLLSHRRLLSLYQTLHASTHARTSHTKVLHSVSKTSIALAWATPVFEFYCVAGPNCARGALLQGASRVVQWVRREEERLFIIGGAVF
ncbi:Vacuolar fusion protein mon1 [Pseudogymnoascus australis]